MPRSGRKKKAPKDKPEVRQDLPDEDHIIGEKDFTSPKGNKYRIILSDELDAYEEPDRGSEKCDDKEK